MQYADRSRRLGQELPHLLGSPQQNVAPKARQLQLRHALQSSVGLSRTLGPWILGPHALFLGQPYALYRIHLQ